MFPWLLPLGSLQTRGGNFTAWLYTHDNSIRKIRQGNGGGFYRDEKGMRCDISDFLFVWVCYPTADKKKVAGRTSRATCSPGMKSRQLNNTASGCGRASLGRKHFGSSILFQSSVSDYFLFQIRTLHTPLSITCPAWEMRAPRTCQATIWPCWVQAGKKIIVSTLCT